MFIHLTFTEHLELASGGVAQMFVELISCHFHSTSNFLGQMVKIK